MSDKKLLDVLREGPCGVMAGNKEAEEVVPSNEKPEEGEEVHLSDDSKEVE